MIAYVTDVEGRWDKLASFATDNPHVGLASGELVLADGVTFVFGGDAIDRGPAGRRIVDVLLAARRRYGDRVVLLAGNRDLNKLRLVRELGGAPPRGAPTGASRGELLRWIFTRTMGAPQAFAHRAAELAATGLPSDDAAVVDSFLADLGPGGALRAYLGECRLAYRAGATLFVHGGVTSENVGVVPGAARVGTLDAWIAALDDFLGAQLAAFAAGRDPAALIAYQAPRPGGHDNPESVVYARPTDELGNPVLPDPALIARLRAEGIGRLVVGHTPSGDCPAIVRDGDFELVLADNSYARIERGSQVALDDAAVAIRGVAELDGGARADVAFTSARGTPGSPLGRRALATRELVKAELAGGAYLLFRGLPEHQIGQRAVPAEALATEALGLAR